MIDILIKFSKLYGQRIDRDELRKHLESSPTYPSFYSIKQSMETLGIVCTVAKGDFADLLRLSKPAILHGCIKGHHHILLAVPTTGEKIRIYNPSLKKYDTIDEKTLMKIWDGVILYPDISPVRSVLTDKCMSVKVVAVIALIFGIAFEQTFLTASSLAGAWISFLSVSHPGGRSLPFCKIGKSTDCSEVDSSRFARIGNISIAEFGLAYFLSLSLSSIFSYISGTYPDVCICCLIGIPALLYSIVTQTIIGKMCVYCIAIDLILLTQILFTLFTSIPPTDILEVCFIISLFFMPSIALSVTLRTKYKLHLKETESHIELLKIKRNRDILCHLFNKAQKVADYSRVWELIGYESSPVLIEAWVSESCPYCKEAVKEIKSLCTMFPHLIKAKIYMIDSDVNRHINSQHHELDVKSVPMLSLNGHLLPNEYRISELKYFISDYITYLNIIGNTSL